MTKSKAAKQRARANRLNIKVREVVRAPRRRRKNRARRGPVGNPKAPRKGGVSLNYSMVPRSRIRGSRLSSDGFQVVDGCEVIMELVSPGSATSETNSRITTSLRVNPTYQWFSRLSGIAQSYQKFRFRKLHFQYHPACPTTRTGVASLAYLENPIEGAPTSNIMYASFDCSFTGSVGIPMSTLVENQSRDPKWFYTTPFGSESGTTDPTAYQQGVVHMSVSDTATADLETLAGYVSVEYVVEFDDLRPVRDVAIALQPRDTTVTTGTTTSIPWDEWLGGIGSFGWTDSNATVGAPYTYSKEDYFWFDEGVKLIDYIWDFGGVTLPVQSPRSSISPYRRFTATWMKDGTRHATCDSDGHWVYELNHVKLEEIPPGFTLSRPASRGFVVCDDFKIPCNCWLDEVCQQRCSHSWWRTARSVCIRAPSVTGDVTATWYCYKPGGGSSVIRSFTDALGTSAATLRDAFTATTSQANAPCGIQAWWDTDGTDTRTMEGVDSYVGVITLSE